MRFVTLILLVAPLVLGLATPSVADEARDAARAEEIMALKEAQREIAKRVAKRSRRAVLATERARAHMEECEQDPYRTKGGDPWYDCRFDTFEPYQTAYKQLYELFWDEEAARYALEVER